MSTVIGPGFNAASPPAIGSGTPAAGTFTTLVGTTLNGLTIATSTGTLTIPNGVVLTGPSVSGTTACLGIAQTWTAGQTFNVSPTIASVGNTCVGIFMSTFNRGGIFSDAAGSIIGTQRTPNIVAFMDRPLELGIANAILTPTAGYCRFGAVGSSGSSVMQLINDGESTAFPLARLGVLQNAFMQAKLQTSVAATTGLTAGVLAATTNTSIVIYDSSGQAYRVPCIV